MEIKISEHSEQVYHAAHGSRSAYVRGWRAFITRGDGSMVTSPFFIAYANQKDCAKSMADRDAWIAERVNGARSISDLRLAYLKSQGEDVRNTVAWQDAVYEARLVSTFENTYSSEGKVKHWVISKITLTKDVVFPFHVEGKNLHNGQDFSWRIPDFNSTEYDFSNADTSVLSSYFERSGK